MIGDLHTLSEAIGPISLDIDGGHGLAKFFYYLAKNGKNGTGSDSLTNGESLTKILNMEEVNLAGLSQEAAQRQLDAYNARDIDAFIACYDEDVILYDLSRESAFCEGRAAMRIIYDKLFEKSPNLHCTLLKRIVCGAFAIDEESVTGYGENMTIHATAIYRVNNRGLIDRAWFIKG